MDSKIAKAYQTVLESQCSQRMESHDEDAEAVKSDVLDQIADGLKKVLDIIEGYKSGPGSSKNIKLPENPEDTSWIPSLK